MPDPGSHAYDVRRTRLRAEYDDHGVPDQHADHAANEELQREHPPRPVGERAAGPAGGGGGEEASGGVRLRSMAFSSHTMIPERYSYDGGNTSPPLEWSDAPAGTQEFAIVCEDPDAPVRVPDLCRGPAAGARRGHHCRRPARGDRGTCAGKGHAGRPFRPMSHRPQPAAEQEKGLERQCLRPQLVII